MSSTNVFGQEVSVDEQAYEQVNEPVVDEDGFEVVDETPELRATVQMEIQAKVDANHPEGMVETGQERIYGATLAQEERINAREAELAYISAKATLGTQEGRAQRTSDVVGAMSARRRDEFDERAAAVDSLFGQKVDPREELSRDDLAIVNRESMRMAGRLKQWSRAAISRRLAEKVVSGQEMMTAVVGTFEELQTEPGRVVPIGALEDVRRREVSIEGRVETLWVPSHPSIAQVGLVADDSGRTRVTIWKRSEAPRIREGELVRIHGAARNWYQGRVSLAVTGWSDVRFPERGRWWE
ncbi:SOSS complex subunit B family protein [Salinigranum halophilum]|uniref:SOSS complex subunit B family protein n=1 Tax=Salinigranum halophilum TaxID=2565931 RepID=UPI00115C5F1D|nr:OB-fold nucleic acid binding domain-containing protein [Salinigranum halophilum]